ncbi:MAG: hypothetical protein KBD47_03525 [Candidatus Pacebacteria bacterium]|nr:hypothetical protein [Candidatus Paceibacterota bacterium]
MILNIGGSGGVGKTTLADFLELIFPDTFVRLVTYTNRKMRSGEIRARSYHFKESEFREEDGFVLRRVRGECFYAVRRSDLDIAEKIVVTTFPPSGVLKLEQLGYVVCPTYLELSEHERIQRMKNRGDQLDSIRDRILSDKTESTLAITQTALRPRPLVVLDARKPIEILAIEVKQITESIIF